MPCVLLAIGGVASAAGTGMQIAGNAQSQSAINKVRQTETQQQAALQAKNNGIVTKSIAASTPQVAQAQMDAGQAARNSAWQNLQSATTPVASALPATTPGSPTDKATARAGAAGSAWNKLTANASAKEGSYGDWQTKQAVKNADVDQQLAVNTNFSQGDANILPTELGVAQQKGGQLSGWGNVVSSIGSLVGLAGATGAFSAANAVDANGVPIANDAAAASEAGLKPATMLPSVPGGVINSPNYLGAANDSAWSKIYS